MDISGRTEAERLDLYHLAQAFGLPGDAVIRLSEEEGVTVTVQNGDKTGRGRAAPDPEAGSPGQQRETAVGAAFAAAALAAGGKTPPYGTLTGVRPVKVARRFLDGGKDREATLSLLTKLYLVSPDKATLLADLAEAERREEKRGEVMLYVSIPFCPSRCRYCSFISSSAPDHLAMIPAYLALLEKDLALAGEAVRKAGKAVSAVYIGGGTPGVLSAEQLKKLVGAVRRHFENGFSEFTVEIGRPDTVTAEKCAALAEAGVDRLCVNPQTTRDEVLRLNGRRHTAADFFRAYETARRYPFRAINCDLIAGLAGDDAAGFLASVKDVLSLRPENLTVHALCRKKAAADQAAREDHAGLPEAVAEAHRLCIGSGLFPYYLYRQKMAAAGLENLGFAAPGTLCRYNLCMMEDLTSVVACGAGAIGKVLTRNGGRIRRFPQTKYPFEYLSEPERIPALHEAFCKALKENP